VTDWDGKKVRLSSCWAVLRVVKSLGSLLGRRFVGSHCARIVAQLCPDSIRQLRKNRRKSEKVGESRDDFWPLCHPARRPPHLNSVFAGAAGSCGISSQVLESNRRPARDLCVPPHCLRKKGTPARWHWRRISRTHEAFISRAPGPDSPPTMTQWMPERSMPGIGPSSGSRERNLVEARTWRRSAIRETYRALTLQGRTHGIWQAPRWRGPDRVVGR
jgi:hypothetical protein